MKKMCTGLFLFAVLLISIGEIQAAYTPQAYILTNLAQVTSWSIPGSQVATIRNTNVTTATMFGGTFRTNVPAAGISATYKTISFFGLASFSLIVSNYGNYTAGFRARVVTTNRRSMPDSLNWGFHFGAGPAVLSNFSLAPFASMPLTFIITNNTVPISNKPFISYLIMISNTTTGTQKSGHVYKGSDNLWYGGEMGVSTNHARTNYVNGAPVVGPVFFLQALGKTGGITNRAGFLTAIISGPILKISKTVIAVTHPSGLYAAANIALAEPGALITYRLAISNVGSAVATNVIVMDSMLSNVMQIQSTYNSTNLYLKSTNRATTSLRYLLTNSGALNVYTGGAVKASLIYIQVRVR
jgi:uncharacterized repeat protein (TIGR01451 family)